MSKSSILESVAGGPEVLMGLTITVSCAIELPIFHYMGPILQFIGVQPMLHWVMFFFLVGPSAQPEAPCCEATRLMNKQKVWFYEPL